MKWWCEWKAEDGIYMCEQYGKWMSKVGKGRCNGQMVASIEILSILEESVDMEGGGRIFIS